VYNRLIYMCTFDSFICVQLTHLYVYNRLIYMCAIDSFICVRLTQFICVQLNHLYMYNRVWGYNITMRVNSCVFANSSTHKIDWFMFYESMSKISFLCVPSHLMIKTFVWWRIHVYGWLMKLTHSCFMSRQVKSHSCFMSRWVQSDLYEG